MTTEGVLSGAVCPGAPQPVPPRTQPRPRLAGSSSRRSACRDSVSARNRSVARGASRPSSRGRPPAAATPATPRITTIDSARVMLAMRPACHRHAASDLERSPSPAIEAPIDQLPLTPPPPSPRDVLTGVFGYEDFRPGQEKIITTVLGGRDCIGVMPTGAGKSLTFQIPARILPGTVLVVSPL